MLSRTRSSAALAALLFAASPVSAASFTPLGDLVGGDFYSFAYAMSADGTTVVGESHSANGTEAFRWNGGVMTGLSDLPLGIFESSARGVSGDGSAVAGLGNGASGATGFVWNTTTLTLTPLAPLLPTGTSQAYAISGNGLVAVGSSDSLLGVQATSWVGPAAPVGLGDLAGGAFRSQALAASADGLTIVGDSDSANGSEAFRWTGTMAGLGDLAGGAFDSQALGASPNGALVVGRGESASGEEAFLWTSGPGMVGLGDLPGGTFQSVAYDVTNGGVVVGSSETAVGPEAFVYSVGTMYRLIDVLVANGLGAQVAGWTLVEARAISDDGLTIAGWGIDPDGNTHGWITTVGFIPEPSTGLLVSLGLVLLARRRASLRR